jgi:thiol-disulfide isomerase/thioredoxin
MSIITELEGGMPAFTEVLASNPGLVIIKLGATWCGPCKQIANQVHGLMHKITSVYSGKVVCYDLDIDECFELYAFLKTKKRVNGVPAILCWESGNVTYIQNDGVIGANVNDINLLFNRCANKLSLL